MRYELNKSRRTQRWHKVVQKIKGAMTVINNQTDNLEQILHYHETTKHHPYRYAASLGYMDWANQPNPFRFYSGSEQINLPFIQTDCQKSHAALYVKKLNTPLAFTLQNISGLCLTFFVS